MKKIAILPTLLTLGNAVCGFAAIAFASKIDVSARSDTSVFFAYGAWLILAAMVFDALDGYVARLSKTASDFGGQLDSLCDVISFGVAPAFLILKMAPEWDTVLARQAISVIAVLYMSCAILRLARFNVENSPDPAAHKRFKGLPSPAAAGCIASLCILRGGLASNFTFLDAERLQGWVVAWAPLATLLVALLMVSRVPYPHLTKQLLGSRRRFSHVVRAVLLVCLIALARELAVVLLFWGYTISMLLRSFVVRAIREPASAKPGLEDGAPRRR